MEAALLSLPLPFWLSQSAVLAGGPDFSESARRDVGAFRPGVFGAKKTIYFLIYSMSEKNKAVIAFKFICAVYILYAN